MHGSPWRSGKAACALEGEGVALHVCGGGAPRANDVPIIDTATGRVHCAKIRLRPKRTKRSGD